MLYLLMCDIRLNYDNKVTNVTNIKVTLRNFEVCMKQSHDSSDEFKFPVTVNEPLSEQTDVFMSFFNILVFCAMTIT